MAQPCGLRRRLRLFAPPGFGNARLLDQHTLRGISVRMLWRVHDEALGMAYSLQDRPSCDAVVSGHTCPLSS